MIFFMNMMIHGRLKIDERFFGKIWSQSKLLCALTKSIGDRICECFELDYNEALWPKWANLIANMSHIRPFLNIRSRSALFHVKINYTIVAELSQFFNCPEIARLFYGYQFFISIYALLSQIIKLKFSLFYQSTAMVWLHNNRTRNFEDLSKSISAQNFCRSDTTLGLGVDRWHY